MSDAVLALNGVTKRYGSHSVLRGVELTIRPGDSFGLIGTNGAGKSTLLRIIAGVTKPSGGTLTGRPTTAYAPDRFPAEQRMSARSYLRHMGRMRGLGSAEARASADRWLRRFPLDGGPDTPLRELSKGNAQRVALAQALLSRAALLVLDEPWSGLDVTGRETLTEVVREVTAEGTAVVFTDHRPDFVRELATTANQLVDGVLKPSPDAEPTVEIVLANGRLTEWGEQPGVLRATRSDLGVALTVRAVDRESVLRTALEREWLVLAVRSGAAR